MVSSNGILSGVVRHAATRRASWFRRRITPDRILFVRHAKRHLWLVHPQERWKPISQRRSDTKSLGWLCASKPDAVAKALGLREIRVATWAAGIEAAYQSAVFVTPPLAGWVLAVGSALIPPDNRPQPICETAHRRRNAEFAVAQYFCTYRVGGQGACLGMRRKRSARPAATATVAVRARLNGRTGSTDAEEERASAFGSSTSTPSRPSSRITGIARISASQTKNP